MKAAPLVYIVGPTATGKSDLAVEIARRLGLKGQGPSAEIISADSVQIYRELVIGSARPSSAELSEIPHHMVGIVSVAEDFTAADFARRVHEVIGARPQTPFLIVGGSGFYIQALTKGLLPISKTSPAVREKLETRLDQEGLESLYTELKLRDPAVAAKIAPQDRYRIVRALEVLATLPSGQTLSAIRREFAEQAEGRGIHTVLGREVISVGFRLDRLRLQSRIEKRARKMIGEGLFNEVLSLQPYWDRPALKSVGYREVVTHLAGRMSEEEVLPSVVQSTLRLAKKQRTWFQRDEATSWFDAETERDAAVEFVLGRLSLNPS